MADKLPTREEFLAFLAAHPGLTPTDAAKEFGVPDRTARRWAATAKKETRGSRGSKGSGGSTPSKPPPAPKARATSRAKLELADLSTGARDLLLEAVELRLRHLASEDSLEDGKSAQAHAIALGILIDKCPDLLKLVGADAQAAGPDDERAQRLARALGVMPPAAADTDEPR